jgi:protein phosphatase 1 regulatory subunit 42
LISPYNIHRLSRLGSESTDAYLQRVTHLHLQGRRIRRIEKLETCTNLKVLYLYDNRIERIENLNFAANLQYLHMQNNLISEVPQLSIPSLTKLYLDENKISYLSGLDRCLMLEELHIAHQSIPFQVSLQFDNNSLMAISISLTTLEISGTGIEILAPFLVLKNLRKLLCAANRIKSMHEICMIVALRYISEVNFVGNPCCSLTKYRDNVIGASSQSLLILDDIPVLPYQSRAIKVP